MKTTLDISDPLMRAAKQAARRHGTTVRALVEHGLRLALEERRRKVPFRLRDASTGGEGLCADAQARSWDEIRALSYGTRGG
jgi:hypothetical protein